MISKRPPTPSNMIPGSARIGVQIFGLVDFCSLLHSAGIL
jgi:hypothetical protein